MSMEMHVLLRDALVPSVVEWQKAIDHAGFRLRLDRELDLRRNRGFVPVRWRGRKAGFELDLLPASSITGENSKLADRAGPRDVSINFRWGGDLDELAAVLAASASLAYLTDGLVFDPQEGEVFDGAAAIARAREVAVEIDAQARPPADAEQLPDFDDAAEADGGVAEVGVYGGAIDAELARGALEAAGIPARILGDGGAALWGGASGLAEVRVVVPRSFAEQAEQVLAEIDEADEEGKVGRPGHDER